MASLSLLLFSFFSLSFLVFVSEPKLSPLKPTRFVLPVRKDGATGLHVANIQKRTPPVPVPVVVDLNGRFLWVNCESQYLSSTYHAPACHSTQCARANAHYCHTCSAQQTRPGCHNNTCGVTARNPVTRQAAVGELAQDALWVLSTAQGSSPGPLMEIPQFLFACAPSVLLQRGFPKKAQGVVGLGGHSSVALPIQLASQFGYQPMFATCLSRGKGVVFFGEGPYFLHPGIDVSRELTFTPLTISRGGEYFITVSEVRVNNKLVPLNSTLLSPPIRGLITGSAMISTTNPYTILEHSLFSVFVNFFANELSGVPRVQAVAPFGTCFDSKRITRTRAGPTVPPIDLVLGNQNVKWRIFGANSMVEARPGVMCLAFVDGGVSQARAPVVIGSYQLEENLVQFDLAKSRLGFSSSLLFRRTSCAHFNFTSM
ncbi:gamma conglutin 1-like [Humulus lupulus]|uniref:gamma conglutin 1-like n=1 Tax=Humulus lupulus TaxID=3486 RepID=UPI002B40CE4E|nr:gamma conglutin 1-like [Humulus lupulus]